MTIFAERESEVRTYCRSFPKTFAKAKGSVMVADDGQQYIDFFAGAGALNYGHNHAFIKERLLAYLGEDGITHSLDLHTSAKARFLETFSARILAPRGLDYKVMFCGPTGTNAVESALKLARKVTGRKSLFSFMGGYHGMSLGSLAATGNASKRGAAGVSLSDVSFMPYPVMPKARQLLTEDGTIQFIENTLSDSHSGIDRPAAVLFETVQGEGGVNVASIAWLRALRALCDRHGILMICDEVQSGCGRTGPFFSFERAGIKPDLVVVSKSISGYGSPMALLLIRRDLDIWEPGEHNGTFRGYQLAMVGATAALELRDTLNLEAATNEHDALLRSFLETEIQSLDARISIRGIGAIWGIDFSDCLQSNAIASRVSRKCFDRGLIVETAGRNDTVLKLLPALTIEPSLLTEGCHIIRNAIKATIESS